MSTFKSPASALKRKLNTTASSSSSSSSSSTSTAPLPSAKRICLHDNAATPSSSSSFTSSSSSSSSSPTPSSFSSSPSSSPSSPSSSSSSSPSSSPSSPSSDLWDAMSSCKWDNLGGAMETVELNWKREQDDLVALFDTTTSTMKKLCHLATGVKVELVDGKKLRMEGPSKKLEHLQQFMQQMLIKLGPSSKNYVLVTVAGTQIQQHLAVLQSKVGNAAKVVAEDKLHFSIVSATNNQHQLHLQQGGFPEHSKRTSTSPWCMSDGHQEDDKVQLHETIRRAQLEQKEIKQKLGKMDDLDDDEDNASHSSERSYDNDDTISSNFGPILVYCCPLRQNNNI